MLTDRQKNILNNIVEDYIKTAQPVGSSYLVKNFKLGCSDATVRNECQVLEKDGYLTHPHTSAGRIPTEKGYREYLNDKLDEKSHLNSGPLIKRESQFLEKVHGQVKSFNEREQIKHLAKSLAEISQAAVLVGFSQRDVFYTGLSYLFSQPEFKDHNLVYNIGEVVDHLDEMIPGVYSELGDEITVKIGSDNSFSTDCSFIGTKLGNGNQLIGLLGPMRMPYAENIHRLKSIKNLLVG